MRQSPQNTSREARRSRSRLHCQIPRKVRMQTILLVDDNDDNQMIYRAILEHVGYRVLECPDGRSAIECVRAESPDLVLMDLAMPSLDGWEVTRILKSDPRTTDIPVLALTARVMPDDRVRSQKAGFEMYLTRPIEPRQVLEEVKRVLGDRQAPGSSPAEELPARIPPFSPDPHPVPLAI